jgi:hypothetical protein
MHRNLLTHTYTHTQATRDSNGAECQTEIHTCIACSHIHTHAQATRDSNEAERQTEIHTCIACSHIHTHTQATRDSNEAERQTALQDLSRVLERSISDLNASSLMAADAAIGTLQANTTGLMQQLRDTLDTLTTQANAQLDKSSDNLQNAKAKEESDSAAMMVRVVVYA